MCMKTHLFLLILTDISSLLDGFHCMRYVSFSLTYAVSEGYKEAAKLQIISQYRELYRTLICLRSNLRRRYNFSIFHHEGSAATKNLKNLFKAQQQSVAAIGKTLCCVRKRS